jgi:hypothetical protein
VHQEPGFEARLEFSFRARRRQDDRSCIAVSVKRIRCPECKYELLYATLGSKGSYMTGGGFEHACARRTEIVANDAMSCPVLRAAAEEVLRAEFPGRDVSQ